MNIRMQLVAFKSLLNRNRTVYLSQLTRGVKNTADDEESVKLRLPFIVVNTSKDTSIDCWLAKDRLARCLCLSRCLQPLEVL